MRPSRWKYEAVHLACGGVAFWLPTLRKPLRETHVLRRSGRVGRGEWNAGNRGVAYHCDSCGRSESGLVDRFVFRHVKNPASVPTQKTTKPRRLRKWAAAALVAEPAAALEAQ